MAAVTVIRQADDLTHVELSGRLDIAGVGEVELQFTGVTAAGKRPTIVGLEEVEFLGSLGIGMLVRAAKALRLHGRSMVLLAPREHVDRVLRLASIDTVIPIASSRDRALELLGLSASS